MDYRIVISRVLATFILSLIFGIERQFSNKPIGFGTYIFVAIGSCGLAISAVLLSPGNPLPLLSGIVTGIGFLGAGALIRTSDRIFGLTSAASVWVFAVFGLCVGIGYYIIALVLYALIWIIILADRIFEVHGLGLYQKKITLILRKQYTKTEIKTLVGARKYKTLNIHFNKADDRYTFVLIIEGKKQYLDGLPQILSGHPDITEFNLE
ncbi:MAG: MgtC/SapB family protein [Spirochaetales bacterium]|nr:MgtC/SapB family protein [Spirochaetales bacterium]